MPLQRVHPIKLSGGFNVPSVASSAVAHAQLGLCVSTVHTYTGTYQCDTKLLPPVL